MSACLYTSVGIAPFPQATPALPACYGVAGRPDRSAAGNLSITLYRATALSKPSPDDVAIGWRLEQQGTYISAELEQAVAKVLVSPATTGDAVELLRQWYAAPPHQPEEYWDDLKAELAENRLTLRKSEG